MKPTKRKAFSFLRSYFDALNEIPDDKDKLDFLVSIINKQFLDEDPKDLNLIAKLSYEGQRHSVEKSVKGYKDKMKTDLLGNPIKDPKQGCTKDPIKHPLQQEEGQEKEKVKEKLIINYDVEEKADDVFLEYREKYKIYALQLMKDTVWLEAIGKDFMKGKEPKIIVLTIRKYMELFLNRLDQDKKIHNNKRDFISHFPNWLRIQKITFIHPKQEPIRYV